MIETIKLIVMRLIIILVNLPNNRFRKGFRRYIWQKYIKKNYRAKTQIILTGFPRGGTTLLYNMLSVALPQYAYDDEIEWSAKYSLVYDEDYVSKNFVDMFHLGKLDIYNIFGKEIKFILLIRDARDVITSVHHNVPNDYFIGYTHRYAPGSLENVAKGNPPLYIEQGLRDFYEGIQHVRNSDYPSVQISYEELVENPEKIQQMTAQALDIKFSVPFIDYYKYTERHSIQSQNARNPELVRHTANVSTQRIQKWKQPKHFKRIKQQFSEHPELFELLKQLNYENEDSWFDDFLATLADEPNI